MADKLRVDLELNDKNFTPKVKQAGNALKSVASRSSSANAAVTELGRGLADAKFGFNGLANNAQRMTELFGSLIGKTGSFKTAMGSLLKSFLGPAGIVFAISTLIAYGPEIVDFFREKLEGSAKDADEAIQNLNESLGDTIKTVDQYFTELQQLYRGEIAKLDNEIEQLNKAIDKHSQGGLISAEQSPLVAGLIAERDAAMESRDQFIELDDALIDGMQNRAAVAIQTYEQAMADKAAAKELKERNKQLKEQNKLNKKAKENKIGQVGFSVENFLNEARSGKDSFSAFQSEQGTPVFDEAMYDKLMMKNEALGDSFTTLGGAISDAFTSSGKVFDSFIGAFIQGITKYIAAKAASTSKIVALEKSQASAKAINAATETAAATPGIGAFILPGLIAAALATVASAFAGGRGGGTTASIASPVSRIPQTGFRPVASSDDRTEFVLRGNDLVASLQRNQRTRSNYTQTTFSVT